MSSNRTDVRDFLVSRRGKITPQQAGLTLYGGNRRVPGLRREEVAMLSGLSTDYYTRLEKGNIAGASETVLHAISDALQLDEAERAHLFDLARTANASPRAPRRRRAQAVRPGIQRLIDAISDAPAFVRNGRLDILAANPLARALYSPVFESPTRVPGVPPNIARYRFLDPGSRDFFPNWDESANTPVQILRTEAGRDPYNKDLTDLVGELSTRSEDFRARWAAHDVRLHHTGEKLFHHPAVGRLTLHFEAMDLNADEGLTLTTYTAEPGSPSADGLRLLASWAASRSSTDPGTEAVATGERPAQH